MGGLSVLYPAYWKRDVIIYDQRGTGRSGLLRCRRLERANLFEAGPAAGACARSLGARRAFYTTRETEDDIDALRAGARREPDRAVRDVVRHQGRAVLRAALPGIG